MGLPAFLTSLPDSELLEIRNQGSCITTSSHSLVYSRGSINVYSFPQLLPPPIPCIETLRTDGQTTGQRPPENKFVSETNKPQIRGKAGCMVGKFPASSCPCPGCLCSFSAPSSSFPLLNCPQKIVPGSRTVDLPYEFLLPCLCIEVSRGKGVRGPLVHGSTPRPPRQHSWSSVSPLSLVLKGLVLMRCWWRLVPGNSEPHTGSEVEVYC